MICSFRRITKRNKKNIHKMRKIIIIIIIIICEWENRENTKNVCGKIDSAVVVVVVIVALRLMLCSVLRASRNAEVGAIYSSELSVSSCFNTFVCDVSRISPAKNISSTTVYTL